MAPHTYPYNVVGFSKLFFPLRLGKFTALLDETRRLAISSFTRRDEFPALLDETSFVFPEKTSSFFLIRASSPHFVVPVSPNCFKRISRAEIRTLDLIIHDLEKWRSRPLDHRRPTFIYFICVLNLNEILKFRFEKGEI